MHGLMMERALTINSLIEHAAKFHTNTEIVSRTVEGPIHRYTYSVFLRSILIIRKYNYGPHRKGTIQPRPNYCRASLRLNVPRDGQ